MSRSNTGRGRARAFSGAQFCEDNGYRALDGEELKVICTNPLGVLCEDVHKRK